MTLLLCWLRRVIKSNEGQTSVVGLVSSQLTTAHAMETGEKQTDEVKKRSF